MRYPLRTGMTLSVILLLFLAFNLVWAVKFPDLRQDFSQQKTNTLSPEVVHLLTTLESPLDFYYFNSSLPAQKSSILKHYAKRVEEKLRAFEHAANGRINLHIIDPAPFSEDAYKAGLYGLRDQPGFFGLIGTREGQAAQRIESFNPENEPLLEYEISHLITQLLHPEPAVIGLLSGLPADAPIEPLVLELHRHFDLLELEPTADHVPSRIKTLMLINPRELPEKTLYAIDQFVLNGGKLLMFIDPLGKGDSKATPSATRLDGLLAGWGVSMPSNKVLVDRTYAPSEHQPATFTLPRQAMNTDDVSTWKLDTVTVSNSGALFSLDKSRATFTPLLSSSRQSLLLDSSAVDSAFPTRGERHVIAARLEGPAYSAFADGFGGQPPGRQKATQIQVVVVADTDMLSEPPSGSAQNANKLFVVNTLDNLAAPQALANIRPRAVAGHSLNLLEKRREAAERAYQDQATELERRLVQTEKEWQRLNPEGTTLGTEAVDTNTQLQALNKERLRLPMELHALKNALHAPVQRLERNIKLLVIVPLPALLGLIAWGLFQWRRRRCPVPPSAFY
ncbi:Gldg family protein [Pseudomonas sp.]|uniref:Gldg family protein n=1 Tax=Pseudomonas sp. TaxID=306 RepID=UPI003FD8BD3A